MNGYDFTRIRSRSALFLSSSMINAKFVPLFAASSAVAHPRDALTVTAGKLERMWLQLDSNLLTRSGASVSRVSTAEKPSCLTRE
jgi:hypothetical protein